MLSVNGEVITIILPVICSAFFLKVIFPMNSPQTGDAWDNVLSPFRHRIDGLIQEIRNSIANALELRLSCINPSKSLSEPILAYCWQGPWKQISVKFESGRNNFHTINCIWKCHPQNDIFQGFSVFKQHCPVFMWMRIAASLYGFHGKSFCANPTTVPHRPRTHNC